jgi:hypothetical protein
MFEGLILMAAIYVAVRLFDRAAEVGEAEGSELRSHVLAVAAVLCLVCAGYALAHVRDFEGMLLQATEGTANPPGASAAFGGGGALGGGGPGGGRAAKLARLSRLSRHTN